MHNLSSFIRLDFLTVKPYFTIKNLLIFLAAAVIMSSGGSGSGAGYNVFLPFGFFLGISVLYTGYPFALAEKNNLGILYATLSVSHSTMVMGRYLFVLLLDGFSGILALCYTIAFAAFTKTAFSLNEALIAFVALFSFYTVLQAMQLPLYFKLGYTKGRILTFLPFIAIPGIIALLRALVPASIGTQKLASIAFRINASPLVFALAAFALWLVIMVASYRISLAFYKRLDA